MDCNQQYQVYLSLTIVLTVLLIMSEFLAWSSCKANGISQILLKCHSSAGDLEIQTNRRPFTPIAQLESIPISH